VFWPSTQVNSTSEEGREWELTTSMKYSFVILHAFWLDFLAPFSLIITDIVNINKVHIGIFTWYILHKMLYVFLLCTFCFQNSIKNVIKLTALYIQGNSQESRDIGSWWFILTVTGLSSWLFSWSNDDETMKTWNFLGNCYLLWHERYLWSLKKWKKVL